MKTHTLLLAVAALSCLLIHPAGAQAIVYQQWAIHQPGPNHSDDVFCGIGADSAGNVYVAGDRNNRLLIIKYAPDGRQLWIATADCQLTDFVIDAAGNVFATGTSGPNSTTLKYNSAGILQWAAPYNGFGQAITLDGEGNIYVTGYTYSSWNYLTTKYNPQGTPQWIAQYNGPDNDWDEAFEVAVDGAGNVYVTGYSEVRHITTSNSDYATIKYDSQGIQQWVVFYNGLGNDDDIPCALALDAQANAYVTGASPGGTMGDDIATVKYDSAGVLQ